MSSNLRSAGEAAPAFQLPNQDGVPSDLADFRGPLPAPVVVSQGRYPGVNGGGKRVP